MPSPSNRAGDCCSPALVEELEAALIGYDGTLVVVTHDRRLRDSFSGQRLELTAAVPTVQP
ncbi:hypothetical protein ABZ348_25900 [Streptomyces sp. NPDC005963]|uniref:hypothetical protein n=1 Tax=Streptomyces sp. NPDC005963 TaxID=3156721 RepID=UPI0033C32A63